MPKFAASALARSFARPIPVPLFVRSFSCFCQVPFFACAAAASTAFCPRVVGSCTNGGGSFSGSIHYRMTKGWEEEEEEYAEEAGPEKRVLYSFF